MGAPEFAVVLAITLPVLLGIWVIRFISGVKSTQDSLRARVEALERAQQRQPQL